MVKNKIMMNTSKIKIHNLTYFFILIYCITGMFKNILMLTIIIIVHEIGHIIFIKYFKYEIEEITFLPFGGQTKIIKDINSSIKEEFIIAVAGILFQLILFYFVYAYFNAGYINFNDFLIFKSYSIALILFNLLPIIPLDGSIISRSILELIFPYKIANQINIGISVIFLFLFIYYNFIFNLNNYLIVSFLLYKIIIEIKYLDYYYNKFLLERYLKRLKRKKIRILNYEQVEKMKKERSHYFCFKNKLLTEQERLHKLFDNKN